MSRKYLLLTLFLVFVLGGLIFIILPPKTVLAPVPNTNQSEPELVDDKSDFIKVTKPLANSSVSSPVEISGQARGTWFFEGSFPIIIMDANDLIIGQGIATSSEEWMTENFIPFSATVYFERPETASGKIILKKDNPSGLKEKDDQLILPIQFDQNNMTVKVYFTTANTGGEEDFDCRYVEAIAKEVPYSSNVARAAIERLLKGPSSEDKASGFATSINPNVKVNSLTIDSGIVRVDFNQQLEYQVGGSCRVSSINEQITKTLKQFEEVQSVVISIDGRTEDILQP
jgi:hypothetical protein